METKFDLANERRGDTPNHLEVTCRHVMFTADKKCQPLRNLLHMISRTQKNITYDEIGASDDYTVYVWQTVWQKFCNLRA